MPAPRDPAKHGDASRPRVLICDDRPVVRAGLRTLLHHVEVVGEASIEEALERVAGTQPDVLLIGLRDDDPRTFHAAAQARARHTQLRVLVIADAATVIELREAVIAGVDSFLLISSSGDELRAAAQRTAAGERVISPSIAEQLSGVWREEPRDRGATQLTPRELEVLQLLAEGLTNQQIGTRLSLSPRTVKTHVQNLLVKLDMPDRTGAVARGFRLGLIR